MSFLSAFEFQRNAIHTHSFIRTLPGIHRVTRADVNTFHRTWWVTGTGDANRVHLNWTGNLLACFVNLGYPHRIGKPAPSILFSIVKAETLVEFPVSGTRSKIAKTRRSPMLSANQVGEENAKLSANWCQTNRNVESRHDQRRPLCRYFFRDVPFRPSAPVTPSCTVHTPSTRHSFLRYCRLAFFFIPTIDYSFLPHRFIGWCLLILLSFICG